MTVAPPADQPSGDRPDRPVARVAVDVGHPHLDRPFDYAVPPDLDAAAQPGVRVRVRFAGRLVDGFVLERVQHTEHLGALAPLAKVVSAEPVLAPEIALLARSVADRYAGTLFDVLRLAVPPRHARVEAEAPKVSTTQPDRPASAEPGAETADLPSALLDPWSDYHGGIEFITALAAGGSPRVVWSALPGWPEVLAVAVMATLRSGRGALVVLPDARDVARLDGALSSLAPGEHVALCADLGPAQRYRRWLRVRRGEAGAVIGTRSAMFAPVADLGLVAIWDDGDDLHAEPRAPYPHAREVLVQRAYQQRCAALVGGHAITAEGAALLAAGWARPVAPSREVVRRRTPKVVIATDDAALERDPLAAVARLPHLAWQVARDALAHGPVLVQQPRAGYLPAVACQTCREPARCPHCSGPLRLTSGHAVPSCGWCARVAGSWRCPVCGGGTLRSVRHGAQRTAEELGRAFPETPVRVSSGAEVLGSVPATPVVIVATPGAEPLAEGGYAAVLLLDGDSLLARADLRAGEETLRRWLGAAALGRPATEGGRVVLVASAQARASQALVRWDPAGHAERELADRIALHFPPAARLARLTGTAAAVDDLLQTLVLPVGADVLGPTPLPRRPSTSEDAAPASRAERSAPGQRRPAIASAASDRAASERPQVAAVVRAPREQASALSAALHAAQALRSARKAGDPVRVQIDPPALG